MTRTTFPSAVSRWQIRDVAAAAGTASTDWTLDFSAVETAFASEMVPICAIVYEWRTAGAGRTVSLVLPADDEMRRLFVNAGWAHLMEPGDHPAAPVASKNHVPATVYETVEELHQVLEEVEVRIEREIDVADPGILQGIFWSLNEVADNVMQHAEARFGIVQVTTHSKYIAITVVDTGRGIYESLKSGGLTWEGGVPGAIEHAVQVGVTRSQATNQGNGLAGSRAIARESDGSMWIWSATGWWEDLYRPNNVRNPRYRVADFLFPGTIVHLRIGTRKPYIIDALQELGMTRRPALDYVERRFEHGEDDIIVIDMSVELQGMRTRAQGNAFRKRLSRLIAERPGYPVRLDWSGVGAVPSSSFADEVFGKLLVEIGLTAYAQRIEQVHISPEAVAIIDGAVMRRMAQAFGSGGGPASI